MSADNRTNKRLLIEDWLPIAELGEESVRERRSMTALPPTYYLHVWWARRPLVASRAAILASLVPADSNHQKFLRALGIHGDPVASRRRIDEARSRGERFAGEAYSYPRAFTHNLDADDADWLRASWASMGVDRPTLLDPTAGGGSIPFEALRLGCNVIANDLNPVAWLILRATVEFPALYGSELLSRFEDLGARFVAERDRRLAGLFPSEPQDRSEATNWLWARTIKCPYCEGLVPLSPNWRLNGSGVGVRIVEDLEARRCRFEIVDKLKNQSAGTVSGGTATCPYSDCGRIIDGDEIKEQARAGHLGQQLYAVIYKQDTVVGRYKNGREKRKMVRGFRAPLPQDDVSALILARLESKLTEWRSRNILPDEEIFPGHKTDEPRRFAITSWRDMFSPRQLYSHCTGVEVFLDLVEDLRRGDGGEINELDKAAMSYVAIALSKLTDWNSRGCTWHPNREVIGHTFQRHDFAFKWSYGEMAATASGQGHDWVFRQCGKALKELIGLLGFERQDLFSSQATPPSVSITCNSADSLTLSAHSVDAIVMDPPYYDNVMYAELADFFFVWLKRTAGTLFPQPFGQYLTEKDREAVANPSKFRGVKGAKDLAGEEYERRMTAIFSECRRVLKPSGRLTVMFTHKSNDAWDAIAKALVEAGLVIEASWPSETEAGDSLHIKEKAAAKSTIFLVCRVRDERPDEDQPRYWEDVEPQVARAVLERVEEFQQAGIGGIDLYLASFGPALQVFSEAWPLTRGRALQEPRTQRQARLYPDRDPYAVFPEDALLAARRVVKDFRLQQLATARQGHLEHLDTLTEWYVLAWDSFRAPKFAADEALKLARVVGLDFDKQVKGEVCEVKGDTVTLWDSKTRKAKAKLGPMAGDIALDALHQASITARETNTGAARERVEKANLLGDTTFKTALEALLNVLPPPSASAKDTAALSGFAADFAALESLRRLAFSEDVPAPKLPENIEIEYEGAV